MQASLNRPALEHGQRRHFDKVSTTPASCIPMQIATMQSTDNNQGKKGSSSTASLRSDCWNSPLCPRNMPSNSLTQGLIPPSCGSASEDRTQTHAQKSNNESGSPTTEVYIQTPATAMSNSPLPDQGRHSTKRARTSTSIAMEIKPDPADETSPTLSPPTAGGKEKRLPHHVIERRYRENLNSQIEALRAAVPSTSACLTLDMEDIGSTNAASAIRPLSKAAVIGHAAEYMRQLAAQNEEVERMNRELRVTVEALRRLVNCEDCGVVQQIVDAGA